MALNTNLTSRTGISATMQSYYDKKLLMNAKPNLVYQQYGQMVVLPKNSGKKIVFRKWTPFEACTTSLTEGVVPDGQSLNMTDADATVEQYGGYVAVSDMLDLTALDPVINDSVELMGDQGGLTIDTLTRDVLHQTTNVQYVNGKLQRSALSLQEGDRCTLSVNEIRKAVRTLKKNKTPQFLRDGKGYYVAIVGPDTTFDLQSDPLWQDVSKYSASEQIFNGEIGKLFGVVFVETTQALVRTPQGLTNASFALKVESVSTTGGYTITIKEAMDEAEATALAGRRVLIGDGEYTIEHASAGEAGSAAVVLIEGPDSPPDADTMIYPGEGGKDGIPVASTLVFGRNAYGVVDLEAGNLKSIIKPRGSAGTADPLDQISTIGWKVDGFAAKLLQPMWIVMIEHCISE